MDRSWAGLSAGWTSACPGGTWARSLVAPEGQSRSRKREEALLPCVVSERLPLASQPYIEPDGGPGAWWGRPPHCLDSPCQNLSPVRGPAGQRVGASPRGSPRLPSLKAAQLPEAGVGSVGCHHPWSPGSRGEDNNQMPTSSSRNARPLGNQARVSPAHSSCVSAGESLERPPTTPTSGLGTRTQDVQRGHVPRQDVRH